MYQMKTNPSFSWPNMRSRILSAGDLADYFLDIHWDWWDNPENTMCGKREQCRDAILYMLNDTKPGRQAEIPNADYNQIYCVGKFEKEFLCDFEFVGN